MENNDTKNGKKKKEGINNSVGIEPGTFDATTPNHYTTEVDYIVFRKSLPFYSFP